MQTNEDVPPPISLTGSIMLIYHVVIWLPFWLIRMAFCRLWRWLSKRLFASYYYEHVLFNSVVMDNVFSRLDGDDLSTCTAVCSVQEHVYCFSKHLRCGEALLLQTVKKIHCWSHSSPNIAQKLRKQ